MGGGRRSGGGYDRLGRRPGGGARGGTGDLAPNAACAPCPPSPPPAAALLPPTAAPAPVSRRSRSRQPPRIVTWRERFRFHDLVRSTGSANESNLSLSLSPSDDLFFRGRFVTIEESSSSSSSLSSDSCGPVYGRVVSEERRFYAKRFRLEERRLAGAAASGGGRWQGR
ncbi:hypothetical protein Syun_021169 [Stephania yunnanensis]|uniref:Uncharacterized protein n=1 Tax=Stephania yunnanensis TaxID=152371 RepID=A0AAP0IFJ0_9MAGN